MPHQRRKSGHGFGNASMSETRKSVTATDPRSRRPGMTSRHSTYSAQKLGKSHREREREVEFWQDERESFPQYCTTCEKQFVTYDERFLYCSENCRRIDQDSHAFSANPSSGNSYSYGHDNLAYYQSDESEARDIVPRASPSRPSSTNLSDSPPVSPEMRRPSAVSSLRSLNVRPPSPPSPTDGSHSFWKLGRSGGIGGHSPNSPYVRPSAAYLAATYDTGYGYGYDMNSGSDRPLPSRHPVGGARPRSIELVTPLMSR